MLALAAVLGERFDVTVLAEASGENETSVVETLRPAVGARLVTETDAGRYQFIHALVRSVLEDALGPTPAVQLHRAGDRALDQLAHDEAAAYYRQALEPLDLAPRPDGEARRCELLIALGEAQRRSGDPPTARPCSTPLASPTTSATVTLWPERCWPILGGSSATPAQWMRPG